MVGEPKRYGKYVAFATKAHLDMGRQSYRYSIVAILIELRWELRTRNKRQETDRRE